MPVTSLGPYHSRFMEQGGIGDEHLVKKQVQLARLMATSKSPLSRVTDEPAEKVIEEKLRIGAADLAHVATILGGKEKGDTFSSSRRMSHIWPTA